MQNTLNSTDGLVSGGSWDAHRSVITRLYANEGYTLKAVMATMKRDYGFFGTIKMYKTRLAQWGVKKNITAKDVPELLHRITEESSQDFQGLVVRGRRIPPLRAKQYLQRNATIALLVNHNRASFGKGLASAPPAPRLMSLPNDMRLPYEVIQLSHQFLAGCCDGVKPLFHPSPEMATWINEVCSAGSLVTRRRFKKAFKVLDLAFDRVKEFLRNPEPTHFILLYYISLRLPEDIGQRLCTYVAEMSVILLPVNHPMALVWSRLGQVDHQQRLDYGWKILHSYFEILKRQYHHDEYRILNFSRVFYMLIANLKFVDLETIEARMRDVARGLERLGGCKTNLIRTQLALGDILVQNKRYEAAAELQREVEDKIHQMDAYPDDFNLIHYYCLAFDIQKATGVAERGVEMARRLMRYSMSELSPKSGAMLDLISDMQSYFADIGRSNEANTLLRVMNAGDGLEQELLAYFRSIDLADGDDRASEGLDL